MPPSSEPPSPDLLAPSPQLLVPVLKAHRRALGLLALVAIYLLVAHVMPRPEKVTEAGWRITGIFLATIAGLMLQPLPGAAVVLHRDLDDDRLRVVEAVGILVGPGG